MSKEKEYRLSVDTLLVHGGLEPSGATSVPIVQSSAFSYETAGELEDVFRGRGPGDIYTRIGNPTNEKLERRLALLEGGVGATATASGMAAITLAVLNIARAGDEIVSSSSLFGGTFSLFKYTLAEYGITAKFADPCDLDEMRSAITDKTRLIFVESIGNPKMDVPDLPELAKLAHEAGVPLVVDATITTPYLARVKEFGADIIVHSTSKFINGTGTSIGGAIIDSGTFNWDSPKFAQYQAYAKKYKKFAFSARMRKQLYKDFGAAAAPMNSFLMTEGIQTLALRMERHCGNAGSVTGFLDAHPKVDWVNYPGLKSSAHYTVAKKLYGGRFGGIFTIGLGSKERAFRFIDGLKLARNLANIGDAKTLVIHPASTICCEFTDEERSAMGVSDDMVRVSVGIEAPQDIIHDFEQALEKV
ncbi:MAG TPA: O-acetylhomoserine aminocarboxypropyltransferase/cysteine synthase family protein [Nitrospirota bacterium]